MASMLAMASARCSPIARALTSRAPAAGAASGAAAVLAGVGVEGAAAAALAAAGAAGAAGVGAEAAAAGVAGVGADDDDSAGLGAVVLGCKMSALSSKWRTGNRTLFTTQTTKPFSSIL